MNANTGDFMNDDAKKQAFRVGYRYAIGTASFYDWTKARRESRPDDVSRAAWNAAFDAIADQGYEFGKKRLDAMRRELDKQTEIAIDANLGEAVKLSAREVAELVPSIID